MSNVYISSNSIVHPTTTLDSGTKIWDYTKIREKAELGKNVIIGSFVYIGPEVKIGDNCKIQNNVQIFEPTVIFDGVFIGPGVIFTNDHNPRAINSDLSQKDPNDWEKVKVEVNQGASIGAGSICVGPVKIGSWAMIGAGSVVLQDVKSFALVVGVPAKQIGWVGKAGVKLTVESPTTYRCPVSGEIYNLVGSNLVWISKNEI
jgi:acetyltransferase-like isoleucine patch superfamily enzyme